MKRTYALTCVALLAACGGDESSGDGNDSIADAASLTLGVPVQGVIANDRDRDFFRFTVPSGGAVGFQTFDQFGTCGTQSGPVDTYLQIYNGAETLVRTEDFFGGCENFSLPLAAGTNYVAVGGRTQLAYTLLVTGP